MYNEIYKQNTDVQITAVQMISAALIFIAFFIVPAGFIERQRTAGEDGPAPYTAEALAERQDSDNTIAENTPADISTASTTPEDSTGQVAGASTTNAGMFRIPFTAVYIDLNSNAGLLTIAGIALFGIGLSLVGYVIFADDGEKRELALSEFEMHNLDRWN